MTELRRPRLLVMLMIFLLWHPVEPASFAAANSAPVYHAPLSFDLSTRRKTKATRLRGFGYSGYFGGGFRSEHNRNLEDGKSDRSDQHRLYLELIGKIKLTPIWTAFGHVKLSIRRRGSHLSNYSSSLKARIKELFLSIKLSPRSTLTFGRMRLSDSNRWVVDRSVDGAHFVYRGDAHALELAVIDGDARAPASFMIFHYTRFEANWSCPACVPVSQLI